MNAVAIRRKSSQAHRRIHRAHRFCTARLVHPFASRQMRRNVGDDQVADSDRPMDAAAPERIHAFRRACNVATEGHGRLSSFWFAGGLIPSRRGSSQTPGPIWNDRVEVTVPRNRNRPRRSDVIIHWLKEPIPPEDITTIDGIPVTKPARTLLDLCTVEPVEVIERCLDDALRRRLVSLPFLDRWLQLPVNKRHRGHRVLRRLVDARATTPAMSLPILFPSGSLTASRQVRARMRTPRSYHSFVPVLLDFP